MDVNHVSLFVVLSLERPQVVWLSFILLLLYWRVIPGALPSIALSGE